MNNRALLLLLLMIFAGCGSDSKYLYQKPNVWATDEWTGKTLSENDSAYHNYFRITVQMLPTYIQVSNSLPFVSKAYATSVRTYTGPAEKVSKIKVISLFDYNSRYKAGADIADSCTFYESSNQYTVGDFVNRMNKTSNERLSDGAVTGLSIKINMLPDTRGTQKFAVVFEMETGGVLTDTTDAFILKP